jgi:hypothetical protein
MEKKSTQEIVFGTSFDMSLRCHSNRKFKTGYNVAKAMVQSTLVSSVIDIEAFLL